MMVQTVLLPDAVGADRWQPVVPAFRLRPAIKVRRVKPLLGQMFLPGIGPTEDNGAALLPSDEDELAICGESGGGLQPTCPNCGGMEFDEDGDCTTCWEPGVVKPAGRRGQKTANRAVEERGVAVVLRPVASYGMSRPASRRARATI
jgi:hypothetical protein